MNAKQMLVDSSSTLLSTESHLAELCSPREVLEEVFLLLEDFGPQWYTEELHDRMLAALRPN